MKIMKFSCTILFSCVFVLCMHAQSDYSKSLSGIEWVKIETKSGVSIKTHDKKELLIKVSSTKRKSEKAKGLKLVGAGGTENTDVGFYVVQDGNTMLVKNLRRTERAEIFLPKTQNVSVTNSWDRDIYMFLWGGRSKCKFKWRTKNEELVWCCNGIFFKPRNTG